MQIFVQIIWIFFDWKWMNLWHLLLAQWRGNFPLNQKERNKVWNVDDLDLQPQGPGTEFILSNARNPQRKCGNYSLIASVTSAPCLVDAVTSPELIIFFFFALRSSSFFRTKFKSNQI